MTGSGLKEVLSIIYAQNSVEKMLSGRAMRAHMLTHLALAQVIFDIIEFAEEDQR